MYYLKYCLFALMATCFLFSCKVTESKLAGSYADLKNGDTLTLFPDHSFEFQQKLFYGEFGWNKGKWFLDGNKLLFSAVKPTPVVGCKLNKQIVELSKSFLAMRFLLNVLKTPINIEHVQVLYKNEPVDTSYYVRDMNSLKINTSSFDSIIVETSHFPPFKFGVSEFKKYTQYNWVVYPVERLFVLDKSWFKYKNNSLQNRQKNVLLRKYKKLGVSYKPLKAYTKPAIDNRPYFL